MLNAWVPTEGRGFVVRAALVIAVTVAAAIAFALSLAFIKFEQRMQDVSVARLVQVVDEVRGQTETALALGLDLAELEDLAGVLQRAGGARDVLGIDLVDRVGRVVFSTDDSRVVAEAMASELRFPAARERGGEGENVLYGNAFGDRADVSISAAGLQHQVIGDTLILRDGLQNGLGQHVGWVVVQADLAGQRQALRGIGIELARSALPVLVLALLLTLLLVISTLRWTLREVNSGLSARASTPTSTPPTDRHSTPTNTPPTDRHSTPTDRHASTSTDRHVP